MITFEAPQGFSSISDNNWRIYDKKRLVLMHLNRMDRDGCEENKSGAESAKIEPEKSSRYFFVSTALS
jgi:hypothetical protein